MSGGEPSRPASGGESSEAPPGDAATEPQSPETAGGSTEESAGAAAQSAGATEESAGATEESAGATGESAGAKGAATKERAISRSRLIWVDVLIWVTAVLAVVAILSVYANRQLLNPDNWSNTSTQLLQDARIRSATANYAVDQLYANYDVAALIKSGLPTRLQPLAGPAAGALRNVAVQGADLALTRPVIQGLWAQANRAAAQTLLAIVNGQHGSVHFNNGVVSLDLASIVDQIASRLGLPANVASHLPPSVAHLNVLKSDQLKLVQNGGKALKGLALLLTILVPVLYALAILLARGHRRRTLMTVGFSAVFAGAVALLARRLLISQVPPALVADESVRPAVRDAVSIATSLLKEAAVSVLVIGLVLAAAAYFAGPSRAMTAVRRAITPFLRDHADWAFGLVAVVMLLIFIWEPIHATGTPAGIIVLFVLAMLGTWLLRRQVIEEFPDARSGATSAWFRERAQAFRDRREQRAHASATGNGNTAGNGNGGVSEQLERLAALQQKGAITHEEYASAKAQVLGTGSAPASTPTQEGS